MKPVRRSKAEIELEQQLVSDIIEFRHDPLGYCLYAFEWGKKGTELEKHSGPRPWQRDVMNDIAAALKRNEATNVWDVVQEAVASGHGIGKSALVAMLVMWAMSTFEDTRGVITANTDGQLKSKTWPEISKWHRRAINRHWFTLTATAMYSVATGHDKTWRVDIVPWSDENTEAFAGLHNEGKRIFVIFDEASGISDKISEVTEGALTDAETEILWLQFGNPTRTTGRFRDCFGRFKHRWITRNIDSRSVEGTNKHQLDKWIEDYGEDSDFVRIRVRGMFPRASALQFIESDAVEAARKRQPIAGLRDPLIMGVDVARGGNDEFVISFRRGMDAKSIPWVIVPGSEARDSMRLITKIVDLATTEDRYCRPDAIFVDETGVGGPIVDRLRQLLGDDAQVYGVQFGSGSPNAKLANMRMYIWWKMREWIRGGGCLPDDQTLQDQLCAPEYYHDKRDRMILEDKETMSDRVGYSPDRPDALAVTFMLPVLPRQQTNLATGNNTGRALTDYDPLSR